MLITIDDLNDAHKDKALPIVERFVHLLPNWVEYLVVSYEDGNQGGAACSPYKPYRRVAVYLSKELLSESEAKIEQYIAHEIAHSYNEGILRVIHEYLPLLSLEDDATKLFHKVILDAVEEQTEDLAVLFCREEEDE